jgi:hypothetical protein
MSKSAYLNTSISLQLSVQNSGRVAYGLVPVFIKICLHVALFGFPLSKFRIRSQILLHLEVGVKEK